MHTASDQRMEVGMASERGYEESRFHFTCYPDSADSVTKWRPSDADHQTFG